MGLLSIDRFRTHYDLPTGPAIDDMRNKPVGANLKPACHTLQDFSIVQLPAGTKAQRALVEIV
jgi:hypothetical protein